MTRRSAPLSIEIGLAEHVCLALVAEGITHGWAIGGLLAPDGELGRIWSLSRPLTYRAIDQLADKQMITRTGTTAGRGRDRRIIASTSAGRRENRRWLDEPVEHLRDVRTELLLKLELRARVGLPGSPLLDAQTATSGPIFDSLTSVQARDLVSLWRRESARAVRRFLRAARSLDNSDGVPTRAQVAELAVSAGNQLLATITEIRIGEVLCTVQAVLDDGQTTTATVTRDAVDELDLAEGDAVLVIWQATDTLIARLD